MKYFLIIFTIFAVSYSCKKDEIDPEPDYSWPWDTNYLRHGYKDHAQGCGGYGAIAVFYKDSVALQICDGQGGTPRFSYPFIVNKSVYHIYLYGYVWSTSNGGLNWKRYNVYDPTFHSYHVVSPELTYCIGGDGNNFYKSYRISGIGKSSLDAFEIIAPTTTQYITDSVATIAGVDSVFIPINDSVDFVVLLN